MNSAELVRVGRLDEGLAVLQSEIREKPDDKRLRLFLFQLFCVLGRFEKALIQLQAVASLDAESMLMAQIFRPVIACELLRRDVFAGKRTPLIFGEPPDWLGMLLQAQQLLANDKVEAAAKVRMQAFESAPASSGKIDGDGFEWIADADSRYGPVIEFIMDGKYYWAPFTAISRIEWEVPQDLRDLVWAPSRVTWTNGGCATVHIPARYPRTDESSDGLLRLGRRTEWREAGSGTYLGSGQRVLATNDREYPLLSCRCLEIEARN